MRDAPGPIALVVALLLFAAIFGVLQHFWRSVPSKPLLRRERLPDFLWWFFTPIVGRAISSLAVIVAIVPLTWLAGGEPSHVWFTRQPITLQILELLIAADLLGYLAHRLFHGKRLWPFHAIHHSAEELDWLSATRVHPLNEIGNRLIQTVPLYLLGFRGTALAAVIPLLTFYALFLHANLRWDFGPLRMWIASPIYHRWHHASDPEARDKNFAGLFPWIDRLFGTYYLPRDRQPAEFGVADAVPRSFAGQLLYPFRGADK